MKRARFATAICCFACGVALSQSTTSGSQSPSSGGTIPGTGWTGPIAAPGSAPADPKFASAQMQARYATIKSYMKFTSPLRLGDEYLAMLGDQASFLLYNLMITRPPLSAAETLTALDILHKSFARPKFIQNTADRNPDKALILLKLFQMSAVDEAVKERIVTERNFLVAVPQVIVPDPMPPLGPPPPPGTTPFR